MKQLSHKICCAILCGAVLVTTGCSRTRYVRLQSSAFDVPVVETASAIKETLNERTLQTLRRYSGGDPKKGSLGAILVRLRRECDRELTPDLVFAFADIAFAEGKRLERAEPKVAAELYISSAQYAYTYLFAPQWASQQNRYDPSFRTACLFYNNSLESLLRLVADHDGLALPIDRDYQVATASGDVRLQCVQESGAWRGEQLGKFQFASDYAITGLSQEYRQYGLGVPLIASRRSRDELPTTQLDRYYPPEISFPLTLFLRFSPATNTTSPASIASIGRLELHDPMVSDTVCVGQQRVPLETDLTTPLAFYLTKHSEQAELARIVGFFAPDAINHYLQRAKQYSQHQAFLHKKKSDATEKSASDNDEPQIARLSMMQPYTPNKIPVVFVHGLGSSPLMWIQMASALQIDDEMRDRYQFWFFFYPTGQPFWVSAALLRQELADLRRNVDPYHSTRPLDEMILVGHSMGGLVSRMQTINSGDEIWSLVSPRPFEDVTASLSEESRERMRSWFFFQANPSVRRVISLATPYGGSDLANSTAQWAVNRAVRLPHDVAATLREAEAACDDLPEDSILHVKTSVASMAPDSRILPTIISLGTASSATSAPQSPIVVASTASHAPQLASRPAAQYHNIVAVKKQNVVTRHIFPPSDGVVAVTRAHLPDAVSEMEAPSAHQTIHDEPQVVQEVRRILKEHLKR